MSRDEVEPNTLLHELLEAMGGAARIAGVRSYAREAALAWSPGGGGPASDGGDRTEGAAGLSLAFTLMAMSDERLGRETLLRAAPGRARLEVQTRAGKERDAPRPPSASEPPTAERAGSRYLAIASPEVRDDHPSARGGPDTPGDTGPAALTVRGTRCPACAGAAVLREAGREPRNRLAHAREKGAEPRARPDGGIEIIVPAEGLLYRFDPATLLCMGRTHVSSGASILYQHWRRVDGIATPFF